MTTGQTPGRRARRYLITILAALLGASSMDFASAQEDADLKAFLTRVRSEDDNVRLAARDEALRIGVRAIDPLADLMLDTRRDVAITARWSIEKIVHHAGRPGGSEERGEVCAKLRGLLTPEATLLIKLEVLTWLGYIGGDRSVPVVARQLSDSNRHVRETARLTLERIPGRASIAALQTGLESAEESVKPRFLYSLGKNGSPDAVATIAKYAGEKTPPALRFEALECLARAGALEGVAHLEAALAKPSGMSPERLWGEYLRLADLIQDKVDAGKAAPLYRRALADAPHDYQREHALHRACPEGSLKSLNLLVASLGDASARVRKLATRRLRGLGGVGVVPALKKAYDDAPRALRSAVLLAMAKRDAKASRPLAEEAAEASDPALRVAALSILGRLNDPELEDTLLKVAGDGPAAVRSIAIDGVLGIAQAHAMAGRSGPAFAGFSRGLELAAASDAQRSRALAGVLSSGDKRAIDVAAERLADPVLAGEAARGVIDLALKIGKGGDAERSAKYLQKVASGRFAQDVVVAAMDAMIAIGRDPLAPLSRQGFVLRWQSTSPIRHRGADSFDHAHVPERQFTSKDGIDFQDFEIGPRRVIWREIRQLSSDGMLDLAPLFRRTSNVLIYTYVEIETPAAQDILFKIGSDDGMGCWLNGKPLKKNYVMRGFKLDEDIVPARLEKGTNKVLLKVLQGDGGWAFSFRVTDRDGKPIDLTRWKLH